MQDFYDEVPKHKKKKDGKSKSNRRSSHKHEYEDILLSGWLFGFSWTERCKICGRLKSKSYSAAKEGLMKPRTHKYISNADYYTAEELHEKFPDIDIYVRKRNEDGSLSFEDHDIEKIEFTNPEGVENLWM